MTSFIPELQAPKSSVPFFEDSQKMDIPGRRTEKDPEKLQQEIVKFLTRLGAYSIYFTPGQFPGSPVRYGYRVNFQYANAHGRIDVAALPMRHEIPSAKRQAISQALYLLRDKIEAQVYASIYEPGSVPLVPYLIGADGKTVTEALIEGGSLPQLMAG